MRGAPQAEFETAVALLRSLQREAALLSTVYFEAPPRLPGSIFLVLLKPSKLYSHPMAILEFSLGRVAVSFPDPSAMLWIG